MGRLFKAFFYRISKDLTSRIIFFIGLGLSFILPLIYFFVDIGITMLSESPEMIHAFCTGQSLLVNAFNPVQNFGIAIPINLVSFIILEFNHGSIRNKIISGHSKQRVFIALFLTSFIYTIALLAIYAILSTAFGSLFGFGGFNPRGEVMMGITSARISYRFLLKLFIVTFLSYLTITSLTVFFSTLFRNIGLSIAIVVIFLMACSIAASLFSSLELLGMDNEAIILLSNMAKIFNPLYALSSPTTKMNSKGVMYLTYDNLSFISAIINNIAYSSMFFGFGLLIFTKSDVK